MGCGLVRVCTVEENREIIQSRLPEALLTTYKEDDIDTMRSAMKTVMGWADVLVLGPGLGTGEAAQYLVDKVLRSFDGTVVLDADGINVLSEHMDLFETMHSKLILTPHLMEMSRLTNQSVTDIKANKYDLAREFAKRHNVVVALKDARTVVSDGGLQAYINITGTNGMATGGSGDVLTGIIAGLLAQGIGTSMLQVPNIVRKPIIWIPAIVSSAVLGPVSTMLVKMTSNATGSGMGTAGFVGQIMTYQTMAPEIGGTMTMIIIVVFQIVLPAVITLAVSEFMRKKGWIKDGDMKLEL